MKRMNGQRGLVFLSIILMVFLVTGCRQTTTEPTSPSTTSSLLDTEHRIAFDWNYGDEERIITIEAGDFVDQPEDPTRSGYQFVGWYSDPEGLTPYSFSFKPTADLRIYARWNVLTYKISYNDFNDEMSVKIVAGWNHNIALSPEGRVFTWGDNSYGQLGDGTVDSQSERVEITEFFGLKEAEVIVDIIAGGNHSFALSSTGRVFAWGRNNYGQLGDGTTLDGLSPIDITSQIHLSLGDGIAKIYAGGSQSFILTEKGKILGWGANYVYQLGNNKDVSLVDPTNLTDFFLLEAEETITELFVGSNHAFAISSLGNVFAWGDNRYGQLGNGTNLQVTTNIKINEFFYLADKETIVSLAVGQFHTIATTSLGRIFTWGRNQYGQLGNNSAIDVYVPLDISARFDINTKEITGIYAGGDQSFVIIDQEDFYVFGYNGEGQLGTGTTVLQRVPVEIKDQFQFTPEDPILEVIAGNHHTLVRSEKGNLYAFGNNDKGQLGNGTDSLWLTPMEVTDHFPLHEGETILHLYSFGKSTFVTTSEDRVFAYGDNTYGQLGDGTTVSRSQPVEITEQFVFSLHERIVKIVGGESHTVALTSLGKVFAWGRNNLGQVGRGTTDEVFTIPENITSCFALQELGESVTDIFSGANHSFAVTTALHVYAWGANEKGQLGNNSIENAIEPVEITSRFGLSSGEYVLEMAAGGSHSLAVTSLGRVLTWGDNAFGQLGNGTTDSSLVPFNITVAFGLPENVKIVSLTAGEFHSGAVTDNGSVFLWGSNAFYQLGDGSGIDMLLPHDITSELILTDGEQITALSAGKAHTIAFSSLGRVFVWGNNYYGQIGDGTTTFKPVPTLISSRFGFSNDEVVLVSVAGMYHSVVLTTAGRVLASGDNDFGQLGIGDTWSPDFILEGTPTEIGSQTFDYGTTLSLLAPAKNGFTFVGWYLDQYLTEAFIETTMPAEDVILYAKWEPVE